MRVVRFTAAMAGLALVMVPMAAGQSRSADRGLQGVRLGRPSFIGQASTPQPGRVPVGAVVGGVPLLYASPYGGSGVVVHHSGPIDHRTGRSHGLEKALSSDYPGYGSGYGSSSGLGVHGRYDDDRWQLRVHLGTGYGNYYSSRYGYSNRYGEPYWYSGYAGCYPYRRYVTPYYGTRYLYGYDPYYYGTRTYYGSAPIEYPGDQADPRVAIPRYQPQQAPEPEVAEPEDDLGKARWNLQRRQAGAAIRAYRDYLDEHSDDAQATRELGLALMDSGELADAVAVLRLAYDTDPQGLADEPIDPIEVLGPDGVQRLGRMMRRMSIYANKTESASSWLAVEVLMQGQGRDRLALKMVVRAVGEGLGDEIAQPLSDALRRSGYGP